MGNIEFKFKTNLNCGGCTSKVQADFDANTGISSWEVDTANPGKILTVVSNGISQQEVMDIVKKKGFTIEPLA
ncbi:heavy-metal-associated domain-containing protein [Myroides sp. LJL115]